MSSRNRRRAAYNRYRTDTVSTSSPMQLVVLLYQRAITALRFAGRSPATGREELVRAQSIVGELQASIDDSHSAELADNLHSLYDYVQERVQTALQGGEAGVAAAQDAQAVLEVLLDGWRACMGPQVAGQ